MGTLLIPKDQEYYSGKWFSLSPYSHPRNFKTQTLSCTVWFLVISLIIHILASFLTTKQYMKSVAGEVKKCHASIKFSLCFLSMGDVSHLISATVSGVTSGFRFPGQRNSDIQALVENLWLIPYRMVGASEPRSCSGAKWAQKKWVMNIRWDFRTRHFHTLLIDFPTSVMVFPRQDILQFPRSIGNSTYVQ